MRSFAIVLALAGCAASLPTPSGPTVQSVSRDSNLCVDGARPRAGDEVRIIRRVCRPISPKITALRCTDEVVSTARVVGMNDDRCATVRIAGDVAAPRPGDRIEIAGR